MRTDLTLVAAVVLAGLMLAILAPPANAQQTSRFSEKSRIRIEGPGFRAPSMPYVNVADWNNDGITDLIIGQNAGPICIYLRNKDGSFQDVRWVEVNGRKRRFEYTCLAVADWNEDGKPDLLIAQGGTPGVELYLNTGTNDAPEFKDGEVPGFGVFKQGAKLLVDDKEPISVAEWMGGISVADWNGDGRPDLLIGNSKGEVWLYLNKGAKGRPVLEKRVSLDCKGQVVLGNSNLAVPYAGDWDRDGRMDLMVLDYSGQLHLYLNKGTGPKTELVPYADKPGGLMPVQISQGSGSAALTDWDGDGKSDLILGDFGGSIYFISDAAAVEKWRKELLPGGRDFNYRSFLTLAFADLNADGKEDVIAGSYNRGLHLYLNTGRKGQPAFREPLIPIAGIFSPRAFAIPRPDYNIRNVQPFPYDWDGDGKTDIIFGDDHGDVLLLTNLGTPQKPYYDADCAAGVNKTRLCRLGEHWTVPIVVDWNKDFRPDLVVGTASGKVYLAINRGFAKFPSFPEFTPLKADGKEINVESYASPFLTDWNGDGAPDLLVGDGKGLIHLFLYDASKAGFRSAGLLNADGNPIKTRAQARPWMTDWNGDGIPDLVIIGPDDHGYCYISQCK